MDELEMTPEFWCALAGVVVLDPDGWRSDGKSWEDPLTLDEWTSRVLNSTIYAPNGAFGKEQT